jgi:hypothetical protein
MICKWKRRYLHAREGNERHLLAQIKEPQAFVNDSLANSESRDRKANTTRDERPAECPEERV